MYICKLNPNVILIKLLVHLTLSFARQQSDKANLGKIGSVTVSSNIPVEGGGKLIQVLKNVTILPGPNLDNNTENKLQGTTLAVDKKPVLTNPADSVLLEGGGTPNIYQEPKENDQPSLIVNGVNPNSLKNLPNSDRSIVPSSLHTSKSTTNVAMEGGGKPLQVEEHVINNMTSNKSDEVIEKTPVINISTSPQRIIPVSEEKPVDEPNRQKIAPRKGVNNLEYNEFKQLEKNATRPVIKKPLFTEASDDKDIISTHSESSKTNSTTVETKPKVPSLDSFNEFSTKTSKYVILIVIVILSVPLVTIIISFLLKRGAEWWKYRHYRRMDFLINGIYDN